MEDRMNKQIEVVKRTIDMMYRPGPFFKVCEDAYKCIAQNEDGSLQVNIFGGLLLAKLELSGTDQLIFATCHDAYPMLATIFPVELMTRIYGHFYGNRSPRHPPKRMLCILRNLERFPGLEAFDYKAGVNEF